MSNTDEVLLRFTITAIYKSLTSNIVLNHQHEKREGNQLNSCSTTLHSNLINYIITPVHPIIKSSPKRKREKERERGGGPIPFLGFSAHCPLIPLCPTPEIRLPPPSTAHAPERRRRGQIQTATRGAKRRPDQTDGKPRGRVSPEERCGGETWRYFGGGGGFDFSAA